MPVVRRACLSSDTLRSRARLCSASASCEDRCAFSCTRAAQSSETLERSVRSWSADTSACLVLRRSSYL
eukprot:UC1_evm1s941